MLSEESRNAIRKFCIERDLDYYSVIVFIGKQIKINQLLIRRSLSSKEIQMFIRNTISYLYSNEI